MFISIVIPVYNVASYIVRCLQSVVAQKNISEMEILFDSNPMTQENIQKLTNYYESPDWRSDFESDERGELPKGLKRGVLSEDGIYNLIEQ